MRKTRRTQRGITLIETMIALAVLATGIAAVFGMVVHVQKANRTMVLQTRSVDVFAQLVAEIQNARCDYDPTANPPLAPGQVDVARTDPGLVPNSPAFYSLPQPNSAITFVGITDGLPGSLPQTVPQMMIEYSVAGDLNSPVGVPALDVTIRITEMTTETHRLADGIRLYPMRKLCNARLDETSRGEFE
jgi:prepilin-type N-terminal cleavage/methylation domain-containing protein